MIDRPIASEANFLFGQTLPYNKRYNDVLLYSRQSPNGKYTIAWGKHSYYVFDTFSKRLLTKGNRYIELYTAYIADNGYFLLEDWLAYTELSGQVTIKFIDGNIIYKKKFPLNIFESTLSELGNFATVWLAGGNGKYANNIFVIDLRHVVSTSNFFPGIYANSINFFDTQENILSIQYSNGNSYRFSISGAFIDEQLYVRDSEKLLVGLKAYQAAKKHFSLASSTNIKDYDHILTLITNSLSSKISDNAKANVYRLLGDIQLRCGNKSIAINAYKTAISFNPKIGLKQMLKNLIKN